MHALIKELAIRRVEHRTDIYSNESQHLAEGTEVACLRRRLSYVLHQVLSLCTRHHLYRQGLALAGIRQFCSQRSVSGSKGREVANWVGGGIGNVAGDGDGDGAVRRTGVEAHKGTQDGNGDREGVKTLGQAQNGNGDEIESSSGDGNGKRHGERNEYGIGEGGGEPKKRRKP